MFYNKKMYLVFLQQSEIDHTFIFADFQSQMRF